MSKVDNIILFFTWLLLAQDISVHSLIVGAIIVLVVRIGAYYMHIMSPLNPGIILYIPWLLKEIWISAISVVKIIWSPKMLINPVFEYITTIQQTEGGMVLYANSITLTPGTYTVDLGQDKLLVHSLVKQNTWSVDMDKRVAEVLKC